MVCTGMRCVFAAISSAFLSLLATLKLGEMRDARVEPAHRAGVKLASNGVASIQQQNESLIFPNVIAVRISRHYSIGPQRAIKLLTV